MTIGYDPVDYDLAREMTFNTETPSPHHGYDDYWNWFGIILLFS